MGGPLVAQRAIDDDQITEFDVRLEAADVPEREELFGPTGDQLLHQESGHRRADTKHLDDSDLPISSVERIPYVPRLEGGDVVVLVNVVEKSVVETQNERFRHWIGFVVEVPEAGSRRDERLPVVLFRTVRVRHSSEGCRRCI